MSLQGVALRDPVLFADPQLRYFGLKNENMERRILLQLRGVVSSPRTLAIAVVVTSCLTATCGDPTVTQFELNYDPFHHLGREHLEDFDDICLQCEKTRR